MIDFKGEITSRIEQLHTRRERDIQRARQLLELQHWGVSIAEEDEHNVSQISEQQQPSQGKCKRQKGIFSEFCFYIFLKGESYRGRVFFIH